MKKTTLIFALTLISMCAKTQTVQTRFKCYALAPIEDITEYTKISLGKTKKWTIPKNKILNVIGVDSILYTFYLVKYNEKIGYVHKNAVYYLGYNNSNTLPVRKEYLININERMLLIGMTKNELIATWGLPMEINRTVSEFGIREQFVYGYKNTYHYTIGYRLESFTTSDARQFVYLDNGIVTSYQD